MKKSQIIVLVLILCALALGIFVKSKRNRPELAEKIYTPLQFTFDRNTLDKVEMGKADKISVTLERANGNWQVSNLWNAPADADKVKRLLDDAHSLGGEKRSDSEALLADYGLTNDKAFFAAFKSGANAAKLLIGTAGEPGTSFVRTEGSSAVYLADKPVLTDLGLFQAAGDAAPDPNFWPDLRFFPKENPDIDTIESVHHLGQGKDIRTVLKRTEAPEAQAAAQAADGKAPSAAPAPAETKKVWNFEDTKLPFKIDEHEVESFLRTLENGRALKIVDPTKDYGFGKTGWSVTVSSQKDAASKVTLDIVSQGEGESEHWFLKNSAGTAVYELTSYTANQVARGLGDFIRDNPFHIVPHDVQGILLKHGDKELFVDRTEDRKAKFEEVLQVLSNLESTVNFWKEPLPQAQLDLPFRIEVRGRNNENKVYLLGEIPAGTGKAWVLRPEKANDLFSLDENTFKTLTSI